MEGYILLTIIVTVAAVLGIQRLIKTNQITSTSNTSTTKAGKKEDSFAEFMKINDASALLGTFDPLTGLPDRQIYDQRLEKTLHHSKLHNQKFSVMILNIDEFENVINVYGNAFANKLLAKTANRLRPTLRQIDTISRYVGDNFYFIFPELSTTEIAILVAQRMQDSMAQPFIIDNHRIFLTASIGIATYHPEEDTTETIIKNAEDALVKAKLAGRNTYRIHYQDIETQDKTQLYISSKIASSLFIERMVIRYQPYFDVYNNKITSLQARVYLNDPELSMIPFEDFSKTAEVSGKALEIALWQLKSVATQLKKWETMGYSPENIMVNIPFNQFVNIHFIDTAKRIFEETKCNKNKIIFDVTEMKFAARNQHFETALAAVQAAGFKLSISILGMGRLSFHNVLSFPVAYVKIDKTLVNDLFSSANNEPIITSLIALLNNTEIKILAEGIEHDYQKAKLLKLGCSTMAGKLFSPEMSEEDITIERAVKKKEVEMAE